MSIRYNPTLHFNHHLPFKIRMTYSNSLKVTNISYRSHTFRAILWENLLLSSGRELDIHLTAVALSFSTIRNRVIPSYRQFSWLGWYDSDVRYTGQSRGPLPLGYTPLNGSSRRIRTDPVMILSHITLPAGLASQTQDALNSTYQIYIRIIAVCAFKLLIN